jgi:hypothetical protein
MVKSKDDKAMRIKLSYDWICDRNPLELINVVTGISVEEMKKWRRHSKLQSVKTISKQ